MNARDYLTVLRESKLIIVGCIVVCLAIAGGMTVITPKTYTSSAQFFVVAGTTVEDPQNPTSDLYQGAQLAKDRVLSYAELIVGYRVAEDAAAALGRGTTAEDVQSKLAVSSNKDTVLIGLTVTDGSPTGAANIASAVAESFMSVVESLETRPGGAGPMVTAQLVQPPTVPDFPTTPRMSLNLIIGGLLGLILGFGLAIARRSLDVSVRNAEDLELATEAAVLGIVPENVGPGGSAVSLAIGPSSRVGASARAEAYRRIRTNLEFSNVDGNRRVLVVTSALPGEGKTTAACNLAAVLAAIGARVLLVEGDLRRPKAAEYLGLETSVGLTSVLTGKVELHRAVQTGMVGGFDVLASGRRPPRPNELLSSRRVGPLIDQLRERYDFVLIDAPPILPVADAMNLGGHADGAIIICRWGKTSRHHVASAAAFLRSVSVPVVGTILTRAPDRAAATWTYYGTYSTEGPIEPEPATPPPPAREVESNGSPMPTPHRDPKPAAPSAVAETSPMPSRPAVSPRPAAQNGHYVTAATGRPATPERPSPMPRPRPREEPGR